MKKVSFLFLGPKEERKRLFTICAGEKNTNAKKGRGRGGVGYREGIIGRKEGKKKREERIPISPATDW